MREINVGLGDRAYSVLVGRGLLARAGELAAPLMKARRTVVVADETVARIHGPALRDALTGACIAVEEIVYPPGEETKSFEVLADLCDRLLGFGVDRKDVVVALGGGVIGDLAGFAAAITMRGVDFIQIPTTLLAQVDSSVGGKTAIDTPRGKNLVGAFHQPRLVLADLDVLDTLPDRQMRAGYAEVLKYGLLGDRSFFDWLGANGAAVLAGEEAALEHAVAHSVAMKAEIVAADERELSGRRALLNLGHTFGHALEAEAGFGDVLLHGEAVALGCAMAFRYSAAEGLCPSDDSHEVEAAIAAAGLPVRLADISPGPFGADALVARMKGDKKAEGGELTLVLARAIGQAFVANRVSPASVRQFLLSEGARP